MYAHFVLEVLGNSERAVYHVRKGSYGGGRRLEIVEIAPDSQGWSASRAQALSKVQGILPSTGVTGAQALRSSRTGESCYRLTLPAAWAVCENGGMPELRIVPKVLALMWLGRLALILLSDVAFVVLALMFVFLIAEIFLLDEALRPELDRASPRKGAA